jgi:hypothetical protein
MPDAIGASFACTLADCGQGQRILAESRRLGFFDGEALEVRDAH